MWKGGSEIGTRGAPRRRACPNVRQLAALPLHAPTPHRNTQWDSQSSRRRPVSRVSRSVSLSSLPRPRPISHRDFELGQPRTTSNPFAVTASRVLEWQDGTYTDSSIRLVQAHLTHVSYIEGSVIHLALPFFSSHPASQRIDWAERHEAHMKNFALVRVSEEGPQEPQQTQTTTLLLFQAI